MNFKKYFLNYKFKNITALEKQNESEKNGY